MSKFNPSEFRSHFPALADNAIYLDSAATALKPQSVIDTTNQFYQQAGTVHRSQYASAQRLTADYEECRQQVAKFIDASSAQQIIWTRGATESINLVAQSWLAPRLQPGDEILVSELEHHANLLPWLLLAERYQAKVVKWPLDRQGLPDMVLLPQLLNSKTRLLAVTQFSNVTGAQPSLQPIIDLAHQADVKVLIDGAQGVVHAPISVSKLGADFYTFSAHKLYGPTGLGVLWVSNECLAEMRPWQGGGKMITQLNFDHYQLQSAPWCFEPGTPNMAAVLGFAAALTFINRYPPHLLEQWSISLADIAETRLKQIPGFCSYRHPLSPILAFTLNGLHPNDLVTLIAEQGIAIRGGQHCAQPLHQALGVTGTLRASFAAYNTLADVEALVSAVQWARDLLTN